MKEERTVWVEGMPYTVVLSDEREALLAAQAVGRAVVGIWNREAEEKSDETGAADMPRRTEGMPLKAALPAEYLAESLSAVDEAYLERVVRRHLGLPWRIKETERLLIREFQADDADRVPSEEIAGEADEIFCDRKKLADYIRYQYGFYEYGIWAVVEKNGGHLIGKAGISRMEYGDSAVSFLTKNEPAESGFEYWSRTASRDCRRGQICLMAELGYHIFKPYRRNGYAAEACRGIIEFLEEEYGARQETACEIGDYKEGRERSVEICLCAKTDARNQASAKVLKTLGFEPAAAPVPET